MLKTAQTVNLMSRFVLFESECDFNLNEVGSVEKSGQISDDLTTGRKAGYVQPRINQSTRHQAHQFCYKIVTRGCEMIHRFSRSQPEYSSIKIRNELQCT